MKKSGMSQLKLIVIIVVGLLIGGSIAYPYIQNFFNQNDPLLYKYYMNMFDNQLTTYMSEQFLETNGEFDPKNFNATETTNPKISDIITYLGGYTGKNNLYDDTFEIQKGKLVLKDSVEDKKRINWMKQMKKGEIVKLESNLWEFDSETGTIIKCLASLSTKVTIPNYINNITVKYIGDRAFSNCSELTSITIPDNITSIEEYTFAKCDSLTSIIIPEGVTRIENNAFAYCNNLTSITINKSNGSITGSPWSATNAKITWSK